MVEWLAGNRIRGTSAEKPALALPSGSVGGWKEVGRYTLGENRVDFDVTGLADKRYYMYLIDAKFNDTNPRDLRMQTGNGSWDDSGDASGNYNERGSSNGGSEATGRWDFVTPCNGTGIATPSFGVGYCSNKSDKEKLFQNWFVSQRAADAGSTGVPNRKEHVWKWANTSNPLDRLKVTRQNNSDTTYLFSTDSQIVVLGWDPADTHTTNFWEQLGTSTTVTSNAIDVSFTAKKYLWIQGYYKQGSGTSGGMRFRVGNTTVDTGANYTERTSEDGDSEVTPIDQTELKFALSGGSGSVGLFGFFNMFIINNASNEKLIIDHVVNNQPGTGAGNAPRRLETVCKWANASDQINVVKMYRSADTLASGGVTVWGSD